MNKINQFIKLSLVAICFLLLIVSCGEQSDREITRSFYYWKTNFTFDEEDYFYFDSLNIQRLYIRFFDVKYADGMVSPTATLQWFSQPPENIEIVPVVFITNQSILQASNIEELAVNITAKIDRLKNRINNPVPKVQIDCDWTASSREKFFELMQHIKSHYAEKGIKLSSTLSLHQVKYAETTGVPPADRAILMFYNLTSMQDMHSLNSILDLDYAKGYMENFDQYPIPLDIALPLFSWGIVYRDESIQNVIHGLSLNDMRETDLFDEVREGLYKCRENGIFRGSYFLKGDYLKIEEISSELAVESGNMLSSHITSKKLYVSLYHWDIEFLERHGIKNIEDIYHSLR